MATIPVVVKHQGKRHEVELDTSAPAELFKYQLFSLTGVEPERQKILIKGGQLKENTDLSSLGLKPGHAFMMMGTPSGDNVVLEPKEKHKFLEDMTESEVAQQDGAIPAGLQNLGNTCYLNSTLQALRTIPELQTGLGQYTPGPDTSASFGGGAGSSSGFGFGGLAGLGGLGGSTDLTACLRDLYLQMSQTQEGFPPLMFLTALRTAYPQFAEKNKHNNAYAQQDAEEAFSQIVTLLRGKLKVNDAVPTNSDASASEQKEVSLIDKYMGGIMQSKLECDDPAAKEAGEEPVISSDAFLKLNCHITQNINHLRDGIIAGLSEKMEKRSEFLGRDSIYTKTSRIDRLPKYLTVHFMRFFWKKEINKNAKIMRKVSFPRQLDVVEFCTDELRAKLIPVRDGFRELAKEEEDVERAKKRQKRLHRELEEQANAPKKLEPLAARSAVKDKPEKKDEPEVVYKTDAEIERERIEHVAALRKAIVEKLDPGLMADDGANASGLYDLRAVITHQGASADSGHYCAYVKKEGPKLPNGTRGEEDGKWWFFNDDRVSEVDGDKIDTLSGGGESHSALICLYRAVNLPTAEEAKE